MTMTLDLLTHRIASLPGGIADCSLEMMLDFMKLAFTLVSGYDENIKGFDGVYVFGSKDGTIQASAIFRDGTMRKLDDALDAWDIKIMFKDARSFWKLIFSGGNDVLGAILENDVEVYGNLNYLYKFGFMAKDLARRLQIPVGFTA